MGAGSRRGAAGARGLVGAAGDGWPPRRGRRGHRRCAAELVRGRRAPARLGAAPERSRCSPPAASAAAEPYLTRYLPALVLAAVLPPLTRGRDRDPGPAQRGHRAGARCRWCRSSARWSAWPPATGPAEQWRAMASLSGHFLDVVRGLPTLVAHRRARAQSAGSPRSPTATASPRCGPCGIAFASSAVLELVATLVGRPGRGDRRRPAGRGLARPAHRAGRAAARARGVLAAAPGRRGVPRRRRGRRHLRGRRRAARGRPAARGPRRPAARRRAAGARRPHRHLPRPHRARARDRSTRAIPARGVTVVTGPSGCGKSTLLAALAGLLPASGGTVTADGRRRRRTGVAAQVAWLPQRPHFVAGTIADNLRSPARRHRRRGCGRRCARWRWRSGSATLPCGARRARWARTAPPCRPANAPGSRWPASSLADRPWVLLDEPTAHLDELTEQVIADTLVELGRRSAVVVVAHRPALVALADHRLELPAPASPPPRAATRAAGRQADPPPPGRRRARPVAERRPPATRLRRQHGPRRPRLGVRRGPHRHRRLADRAGLHPAARADAAGRDRRRPHLRPGPTGAALRRAAALARRRAAAARPIAGCRSTTPSSR